MDKQITWEGFIKRVDPLGQVGMTAAKFRKMVFDILLRSNRRKPPEKKKSS